MLTPVNTGSVLGAGTVKVADIDAVIADMQIGDPYKYEDLYEAYRIVCIAAGREPGHYVPVSKAFSVRENLKRGRVYESASHKQVRVYRRLS